MLKYLHLKYSEDSKNMGKLVISKAAAVAYIVVTLLIILAVGLLVGLVGRPEPTVVVVPATTTTKKPATTTTSTLPQSTTDVPDGPWRNIRLPTNLVPSHYMVDLQPVLVPGVDGKYWFNGTSEVTFMATEDTDYIIIQTNKLEYSHVSVKNSNGDNVDIGEYWLYDTNQFLIVPLVNTMANGSEYILRTEFMGELAADLGGLYRSTFVNDKGVETVIATTQMQPTDARKAFPCFDEPALKATFDIFLWHQDPNFALSNMPNVTTEDMGNNWKRTRFNKTVVMSTYLLAFVVCDFDYVESFSNRSVQTRIYARPQQVMEGNADYAKNITPVILDYFTDYFDVDYPLPKSDQIAVPDFAAGAMENWGLVIYRETALLYNPAINSASNQQRVAVVVSHELAHQWFGNLISPLWWDELWLNEGFASYVEYLGVDIVQPTWGMMDQFVVVDLHRSFDVDALTTSRPIVALDVETPFDINALFDTISYSKGACIIRMINQFTGENAFKLGLTNYLNEYAYGPVNHYDLFAFWEAAMKILGVTPLPPGDGFVDAMNTWTLQMGFPVVKMERVSVSEVQVTQQRFLLDGTADKTEPPSNYSYKWDIPFWYKEENKMNRTFMWIDRNQATYTLNIPNTDFYIGNYEAYGYYRVNYDKDNWQKIIRQLDSNYTVIPIKSRAQLIDDAFNLARAGELDYTTALDTTKFLREDLEYIAWESALDVLAYFDLVLGRSKVYGVYSEYLSYLVKPVYNKIGWEDTTLSHLEQYQQVNAIGVACSHSNKNCTTTATNEFNNWMTTDINKISPNLRSVVYCQAIANGGSNEWDFVFQKYLNETNSQERAKLEYALACTQIPWVVRRFLDYVLNETYVRKQDVSSVLQDLCYNEYARDITWDHIRQNWDYIYNIYGTGFFSFSGIITGCTSHFSTEFELQELEEFKVDNIDKLGSGVQSVEQAIETTKTNIQWRTDNEDTVFNWLTDFVATIH